jgi:hypothetical protein
MRTVLEIEKDMQALESERLDAVYARDDAAEQACGRRYEPLRVERMRAEAREAAVRSSSPAPRWQAPLDDNQSLLRVVRELTARLHVLEAHVPPSDHA